MKLFYDARYIRPIHDGISRYSTEIAGALWELVRGSDIELTFLYWHDNQLEKLPKGAKYLKIHYQVDPREFILPQILNKYHPDVVFSPLHTPGVFGAKYKKILTSHDMIYYHHHTPPLDLHYIMRPLWRLYFATYWPQRLLLNKADLVVTVSESAKKQFQRAKLTRRPILVVPNAPDAKLNQFVKKVDLSKAPRNIVYMGAFIGYKNVELLVRGMKFLPGYTLHLLSRVPSQRKRELSRLAPKNAKIIFHNGVSDQQYAELLADNAILATASLDEGFGLPVAEALTLGVPAVITNMPVFHEVAGNGALFFNPHDPRDFAKKVEKLDDKKLRLEISKAGLKHISNFNWYHSANILLKAIKELYEEKG